jgi:ATP-dependent Lon protease
VPSVISEYTIEGRKAINILADAYGLALYRGEGDDETMVITVADVYEVVQVSRLSPYVTHKASAAAEIGKIFGLGVAGYLGSVLEIEAVAFPSAEKGKGHIRFNDTAGSMAKDSVFNAAAVVRKVTGKDLSNYDIHVNIIGGGRIDGPSAGTAIVMAIISAIEERPLRQDVAITGEISIQGRVKAVGGVFEKVYGAKQAGVKTVIIPQENAKDVPPALLGVTIYPVDSIEQVTKFLFGAEEQAKVS